MWILWPCAHYLLFIKGKKYIYSVKEKEWNADAVCHRVSVKHKLSHFLFHLFHSRWEDDWWGISENHWSLKFIWPGAFWVSLTPSLHLASAESSHWQKKMAFTPWRCPLVHWLFLALALFQISQGKSFLCQQNKVVAKVKACYDVVNSHLHYTCKTSNF